MDARFFVYVEGPRDGHILRIWARLVSPQLSRRLVDATVILGGRQPARALIHLRAQADAGKPARGLCVLDRDGGGHMEPPAREDVNLEFFIWGRRHIESYLLVPDAIRRGLRVQDKEGKLDRTLREKLPAADDDPAWNHVDAKRLLDRKGPISRCLGRPVNPGHIARAMRAADLHPEVQTLLERIGAGLGVVQTQVVCVDGSAPAS